MRYLQILRTVSLFGVVLAIEPIHCRRRSFFQNHLNRLHRRVEDFVHNFFLRLAERRQHIFHAVHDFAIGRNSEPNPQKLVGTQGAEDGFHPVVPRRTPSPPDANRPQRQVELVVNHNQVPRHIDLMFRHQFPHRKPTQVHVGFRFGQDRLLTGDRCPRGQRAALAIPDFEPESIGDPINRQEPEIVRRELVLDSRIAQTDDQFHAISSWLLSCWPLARSSRLAARTYFLSFFSLFSAFSPFSGFGLPFGSPSASPSPSVSCLPFLMTSGSAGVAAASATTSGAATTSSFTVVMCAIIWFSSVRNFSFSLCGRSFTRTSTPNTRWLMSTSRLFGMSDGRPSISISRNNST